MTIYINGFRASREDLDLLIERCKKGLEILADVHMTKLGGLAFTTV